MLIPLALMAAGVSQYRKYKNDQAEEIDRAADREYKSSVRNYEAGQRERTTRLQKEQDEFAVSMKNAAKPAVVEPVDIPAEGPVMPGDAPPMKQGFKVNGAVVGNEIERDKAVSAYDSPVATMRRQAGVSSANGRPKEAVDLQAAANSWEADQGLREAGQLLMRGGWKSVPQIYARYNDGIAAKVEEDGKGGATVIGIDEKTGNEVSRQTYSDLPQLFASVAGQFDPKLWVADTERRTKDAEGTRRWNAEQAVREKNADSAAELRAAQADAAGARAEASILRAKGSTAANGLTLADLKDGHKTIASTLNSDYKTQIDNEPDPFKVKAIKTARESEIDSVQRVYTGAMTAGIAMTPEQAIAAFRTGEVGKQTFKTKDGSTTTVDVLRVDGRLIPMSALPGVSAPAPVGSPKPSRQDAAKPASAAKTAPAKPEGPGLLARMAEDPIVKRISDLGTDYSSEAGKAALVKRVTEAGQGGTPLTEVETLRAKQAGLI